MFFPIQVFWMSLAFAIALRLATKYQPSGNGEGNVSSARSPSLVVIDRHTSAGLWG